jgi:hypothetical protein
MIGAAHNLDTSNYSIPYVASWASTVEGTNPTDLVMAVGERVRGTASIILDTLTPAQAGQAAPSRLTRAAPTAEPSRRGTTHPSHGVPTRPHSSRPPVIPGL